MPATSALIDEACGIAGNALLVGEGPPDDTRVLFVGLYYRGQRHTDLEREYLDVYHPINEGIPRQLQLPANHLVPIKDLYTAEELHTSRAYNEALLRGQYQQGLNVLLAGPGGAGMTWSLADPVASEGRCCMNTLWGWGRASWAGCGPDVRRGGQTLIMGYSADKSPLIGHLAGPLRRLEPLVAQRQEKCGPNRPTPTGYSCNNADLRHLEDDPSLGEVVR